MRFKCFTAVSEDELTSWEIYNIILKGFVDQMIALGASKDLKFTVLQVWASYLRENQVAFHNKKIDRFNLSFHKR